MTMTDNEPIIRVNLETDEIVTCAIDEWWGKEALRRTDPENFRRDIPINGKTSELPAKEKRTRRAKARQIYLLWREGLTDKEIAEKMSVGASNISHIRRHRLRVSPNKKKRIRQKRERT